MQVNTTTFAVESHSKIDMSSCLTPIIDKFVTIPPLRFFQSLRYLKNVMTRTLNKHVSGFVLMTLSSEVEPALCASIVNPKREDTKRTK